MNELYISNGRSRISKSILEKIDTLYTLQDKELLENMHKEIKCYILDGIIDERSSLIDLNELIESRVLSIDNPANGELIVSGNCIKDLILKDIS